MFKKVLALVMFAMLSCSAAFALECKISNQLPPSHHISKGLHVFADKVSELSGGKIVVKVFDSAQLYKDTEILEAIQEGNVEMGLVATNKWGGMVPAADVFDLPFVFVDLDSPRKFLDDGGAGAILDKEFQAKGIKNLFWVDYGFIQMWNNKRPLRRPEDFVGVTLRSFSAGDCDTLRALGAAPTLMSSSEMYMALQNGTMNGATTGMPAAVSRKIHEVSKWMTRANYSTAEFTVQANLEWWEELKPEDQKIILEAGKVAEAWIRNAIAASENAAEEKVRAQGVEIVELTAEDRAALVAATKGVKAAFVKRAGKVGAELVAIADKLFN